MNINEMVETLGKLRAPDSSETAIAEYLMSKLHGYHFQGSRIHRNDVDIIATVLQAYARMLQSAGVTA